MTNSPRTLSNTLLRAAEIGQEAGLNFVYAGNLPGRVSEYENTYCPGCRTLLVERQGFTILGYHLTPKGSCPKCGIQIPGVWSDHPETVRTGGIGMPRLVIR